MRNQRTTPVHFGGSFCDKGDGALTTKQWTRIALAALIVLFIFLYYGLGIDEYMTFETVKAQRAVLASYVSDHFILASLAFILLFLLTAFFLPGALVLTVTGGFIFGTVVASLYVIVGGTLGASLAFLASRYVIGEWFQDKFSDYLHAFNREARNHGHNYLFTLRVIPALPFFVVNYAAGMTQISLQRFAFTTALGMIPGSLLYAHTGNRLGYIDKISDIWSAEFLPIFSLFVIFASLPTALRIAERYRGN